MSEERGFVRVVCTACNNPDVWFRCNTCQKSDHFVFAEGKASCDCGASYTHGTCTCGASVPASGLLFVPFEKGPMALADLEVAWGRVIALGLLAAGSLVAVGWWFFA